VAAQQAHAFYGAVAQLGERGLCKPEVVSSILISSTDLFGGRQLIGTIVLVKTP
jgi:hypothetical protein